MSATLSLLLRQQRPVHVAASLKPTVATAAKRSCASFEISHGHSGILVPCTRSQESAGHLLVYFVTGPMVGDCPFLGATILGGGEFFKFFRQPYRVGLSELRDASWTVDKFDKATNPRTGGRPTQDHIQLPCGRDVGPHSKSSLQVGSATTVLVDEDGTGSGGADAPIPETESVDSSDEKEQAPASEDVVAFEASSCEGEVLGSFVEETDGACDASSTLQKGVLRGPVGGCRCVSGPGASVAGIRVSRRSFFFLVSSGFSLSVSKERAATQEPTNSSTRSADTGAWHRPENRNFFRYLQRPRRTSTTKSLLKVSSRSDPVRRVNQGTESVG